MQRDIKMIEVLIVLELVYLTYKLLQDDMKKFLLITVLFILWSNTALTKILGIDKSVDYYLSKEDYELHSTGIVGSGVYVYHLIKDVSKDPDLITCVYNIKNNNTICFAP